MFITPLVWRLGLAAGALALMLGAGAWVHHLGYSDGYGKASAECAAEKRKQEAANQNAIAEAEKALLRAMNQWSQKSEELDDAVAKSDAAAAADPDGGVMCLPPDSVLHLNAIR